VQAEESDASMATVIESSTDEADRFKSRQEQLKADGVEYCLSAYVDVHGVPKCKAVPIDHFIGMMQGSELFTGAALDGLGQEPCDDELAVRPDLDAITALPWEPTVAWAPGQLYFHGEPWPMDSRNVLRRQVDRAAQKGMVFNLGIETEFFLVQRENGRVIPANPKDTLAKAAYDIVGLLENMTFMDEMVKYMNVLGWDVHSFDHEDANSQFEFDFSYTDAMGMADRLVLWRMMTKTLARRHGCEATFMPKPYADRTGSGGHYNMSLADAESGANLFADPDDPRGCGVSALTYQFIAGVLRHAPAICAVTASTVNSYKRLIKTGSMTGFTWAPVYISYGNNNRTHMLRIPMTSPRVESRAVDMTTNPYLGAAMMLAAGLEGIEQQLDPGDPIPDNMYLQSDQELQSMEVKTLPRTLLEAIEAFDQDPLTEEVMGPELKQSYVELKKSEWWDYHNAVSSWELDHYLTFW
jgi:glutamine synthetase